MPRLLATLGLTVALAAAGTGAAPEVSPDPAKLRVPPEDTAHARVLVGKLGSELFRERDDASRELAAMGRRALVALQAARADRDLERAARVRQLLPLAADDEMTARVEAFLADAAGRYTHDVPGWPRFRAALGDAPTTRELFTELVRDRANFDILTRLSDATPEPPPGLTAAAGGVSAVHSAAGPPEGLLQAVATRRGTLQGRVMPVPAGPNGVPVNRMPTPAEFALILLAESAAPEQEPLPNGLQFVTSQFFYQQVTRGWLAGGHKFSPALKALTDQWLDTRPNQSLSVRVGQYLQLPANTVARFAARSLVAPTNQPHDRVLPIQVIAATNDKRFLRPLSLAFADDRTLLAQAQAGGYDIRVRDFALVVALRMTGQNPLDFGFETRPTKPGVPVPTAPSYLNYYFNTDDKASADDKSRAAFARWRDFETGQLGAALGGALAAPVTAKRLPDHVPIVVPKPRPRPGGN